MTKTTSHQPVLLEAVLSCLQPNADESYLDLTAGYGGHAQAILARTNAPDKAVLVDRDEYAIQALRQAVPADTRLLHSDFASASSELASEAKTFDLILADLGVSSPHLNIASRGFSIQNDGPLDMRMDSSQQVTAAQLINETSQSEIEDIIRRYGEEPRAKAIANAIVGARPLYTTKELADIITSLPGMNRHGRIHPATKTFQALRIAVNDELGQLEQALPLWLSLLSPEGRLAIISFHSLEDRLVKQFLAEHGGNRFDAQLRLITKKPLVATKDEIVLNPRARSAKLRAAVKIKTK